jgi:predicted transcriptional regulator
MTDMYDPNDGAEQMLQTSIRLPEYQMVGLKKIAIAEDRNTSSVIRHAIRLFLEAHEEQNR